MPITIGFLRLILIAIVCFVRCYPVLSGPVAVSYSQNCGHIDFFASAQLSRS
jgi:hypothetical protein